MGKTEVEEEEGEKAAGPRSGHALCSVGRAALGMLVP